MNHPTLWGQSSSRHRAKQAPGAGCPLPGGAALAPAYVSVTFVAVRRPGKAQPPPGKNRRLAPDAHCQAALRLRRPT
ncbi:hypothetical protein ACWJS4_27655, partial [Klebsiella pneumoniae]